MDVSIAVSLIRGQMGTVVERAVNVAVETVLAEMLRVVGVKFEELKVQVVLMKKEMAALQREKALKDKENDNIRAKLRYTELKLKYYRQGVEEELQQRAPPSTLVRIHPPASALVRVHPPTFSRTHSAEAASMRSNQVPECTSSQSEVRPAVGVRGSPDATDPSDRLLPGNPPAECLDGGSGLLRPSDAAQRSDVGRDECQWTVSVLPDAHGEEDDVAPPPGLIQTVDAGHSSTSASLSPDVSAQADSSVPSSCAAQVKQEVQAQQQQEVICIKEEPEEEQKVTAALLLDRQAGQDRPAEAQAPGSDWSRPTGIQMNLHPAAGSAGPSMSGLAAFSLAAPALGGPPRQAVRPWPKELGLYEEYKLRRNELRRRNLNRRRELEKTLPQPLLADLVRERREKTRLRVARWRAKRKLQACMNQAQAHGGPAVLSQTGFPASSQQLTAPCAVSNQQRRHPAFLSSMSTAPPLLSSSSSSLLLRGPSIAPHEHAVTSSSSYQQPGASQQSVSLTDSDLLQ